MHKQRQLKGPRNEDLQYKVYFGFDSSNYRSILTIEIRETTSCDRHRYTDTACSVLNLVPLEHTCMLQEAIVETVLDDVTKFLSVMLSQTPLYMTNP